MNDPIFATEHLAVHTLGPDDAPRLQAVYEGAADYFRVLTDAESVAPDTARAELAQCAAQPGRRAAVITGPHGTDVGALGWWSGHPEPDTALLGMIVVLPEHRGGGLAREALAGLEGWLAGQGITRLRTAIPYRRTLPVRALLQALGFAEMSIAEHSRMGLGGAGISLWEKPIG